ncbi:hypothetical protein SDE12394_06420 [Streptococcus dysgalactiae subsp. equisimilis ATCC 12394]|nr:hypothetical protein SDE12394_06420 [Streptococcus dysgalactiae subsp. equisimilis ATCC 12394]
MADRLKSISCFGTIQNNIALKLPNVSDAKPKGFGTIQNNIALKLKYFTFKRKKCFGTIQNNIALKRQRGEKGKTGVLGPFKTT